jgi:Mg2+/Co2+ transporter CorB
MPRTAGGAAGGWNAHGEVIVAGGMPLRELNRRLGLRLPLDGPKTLNGLILELLEAIPEGDVSLLVGDTRMEVMQIDNQAIRTVKLFKPPSTGTSESAG